MADIINHIPHYMLHADDDLEKIVERAQSLLGGVEFDTLVGTGMSGALVIPQIAKTIDVNWYIVRKKGDGSHSCYGGVGKLGRRWVFVDDLIDTGATLQRVVVGVEKAVSSHWRTFSTTFVGAYLFDNYGGPPIYHPAKSKAIQQYLTDLKV